MALSIDTIPNACRQANKPAIRLRHAGSEPGARETAYPEDDDRQSFASQSTPDRRLSHGAEGWNRLAEPGRVDDRPPILSARACGCRARNRKSAWLRASARTPGLAGADLMDGWGAGDQRRAGTGAGAFFGFLSDLLRQRRAGTGAGAFFGFLSDLLRQRRAGTGAGLETRHVPEIIRGHRRTQSWNAPGSRDRHRP